MSSSRSTRKAARGLPREAEAQDDLLWLQELDCAWGEIGTMLNRLGRYRAAKRAWRRR